MGSSSSSNAKAPPPPKVQSSIPTLCLHPPPASLQAKKAWGGPTEKASDEFNPTEGTQDLLAWVTNGKADMWESQTIMFQDHAFSASYHNAKTPKTTKTPNPKPPLASKSRPQPSDKGT